MTNLRVSEIDVDDSSAATKACDRCRDRKPRADFYRSAASPDGLQNRCKTCTAEARAASRATGPSARGQLRRKMAQEAARREIESAGRKQCRQCFSTKALDHFHKRTSAIDGYYQECKTCRSAAKAAYYLANRESVLAANSAWRAANKSLVAELDRAWHAANRDRGRDAGGRRRARERAARVGPVDLTELWTGTCGLCGLTMDKSIKHPDPMSPSVDHIVPISLGGAHEQSNLQWTHFLCNLRKGDRLTA